jgi:aspartate aminotransferase
MGYAVGPKEIIAAMTKLQGQVTTNINSMTQWACVEALNGPQEFLKDWVGEFKKRRDYIVQRFNAMPGIHCYNPQGAFYVFPNISSYIGKSAGGKKIESDSAFCDYILDKGLVAIVAGSGFGAPGYMRLSYATSMENIKEGLDRIEKVLKDFT